MYQLSLPVHLARMVVAGVFHHRTGVQSVWPGTGKVDPTVPSLPIRDRPALVPSTSRVPSGVDR